MNVSEKQNKNTLPVSPFVLRAEDINQLVSELQYIITLAELVPDSEDTTQVWEALQILFATLSSTQIIDDNGENEKTQSERNREYEAALAGGVTLAYPECYLCGGLLTYNSTSVIDIASSKSRSSDNTKNIEVAGVSLNITTNANWASGTAPTLTSLTVYIWAVYNSGSPKYLFDNATGSNIAGEKRLIAKFKTNASSQILLTTLYSYSNPPTIVDHFRDGASWYRVWSDGFVEQGGTANGLWERTNTTQNVTFLIPFTGTDYNIQTTAIGGNDTAVWTASALAKTTTGFSLHTFNQNEGAIKPADWVARGY